LPKGEVGSQLVNNRYQLLAGADPNKDQSYFLLPTEPKSIRKGALPNWSFAKA